MRIPARTSPRRVNRRTAIIAAVSAVVGLIILGGAATLYTDLLWFREVGFSSVFTKQIYTKLELGAFFGLVFAAILLLNLWIVQKITSPQRVFSMQDQILERYRLSLQPYVRKGIVGMAVLFGLFAGSGATSQWRNWLLFNHSQKFGQTDPLLHKDFGFFVFRLPFHRFVFTWAFSSLLVITILTAVAHYFMGGIKVERTGERVAPHVKAHLSVLMGLIVLLKAWGYRLDQYSLLYSSRGTVTGATYTDVHADFPALKLLVIIAFLVAVLFLVNIRFRGWILPAAGIGLLVLTSIIAHGIYPAIVQRLRVTPVEREKEKEFIKRNIDATRQAFDIDQKTVTVKNVPPAATLKPTDLTASKSTVDNIRLWTPKVMGDALTQLQRITNYYEFLDTDVDRYDVGGTRRQVLVSPREINPGGLPSGARTWVNNHLVYTHGFGVVASRVDRVNSEGQPEFLISDIPPQSVAGAPTIDEPRIYFGESEEQRFVVVKSDLKELDYPTGETGFQSSKYTGTGGVKMSGFLRRAAFAWRFRDVNLLISGAIKGDSRLMFRRKVADRVRQVAPFLQLDGDPYMVVADKRLVWVIDGYTTTANYPYAQRIDVSGITNNHLSGRINYIRNSVKATVDAMNGNITLYQWDPDDPIIKAWRAIFPSKLFKNADEMPAEIRAHVRYPEDLFTVQADRYGLYHITDPIDFYSRNDVWRIPNDPTEPTAAPKPFPPYYVLMNLPGEKTAEFVLMVPFSPFSSDPSKPRQNMTAWIAARSDPANYGQIVTYVFGKEKLVFGPEQVQARIDQDAVVQNQLTLVDPTKDRRKKGNLLVIPIGDAIIYVQPIYLTSASSNLPEFKRVVVVSGDTVAIGETLEQALGVVLGKIKVTPGGVPAQDVASLIADALRHYDAAQKALAKGDFATYGAEQKAMKDDLDKAQQGLGPAASPSPSPSPSASAA